MDFVRFNNQSTSSHPYAVEFFQVVKELVHHLWRSQAAVSYGMLQSVGSDKRLWVMFDIRRAYARREL
jgi:hypothetical protein